MPRYVSIWFPYLLTEYTARKNPEFRHVPFVLASRRHGRMVVDSVNGLAAQKGIRAGAVLADCKAIFPELQMLETESGMSQKLLAALAEWCIRYTPVAAVDMPDGLMLDASGCAHLWNGEVGYLENIRTKLGTYGYTVQIAMADTIGAAWAMARFGGPVSVVKPGRQGKALQRLPAAALRLDTGILLRLKKLGLQRIDSFMNMPQATLRRRFGPSLYVRLGQALGHEVEMISPVKPVEPYQERLSTMEPIATATGITIALRRLLEAICARFAVEGIGLRKANFKAFRVDGDIQQIEIGTGHPSRSAAHLFKLFEHKIATLEPALGFELFVLEAPKVESITDEQAAIWEASVQNDKKVAELLDRVAARTGPNAIVRYLPAEHYWPERSARQAMPLWETPTAKWPADWPRPMHLLQQPEAIEVMALLPDYPPKRFIYKKEEFLIRKSDGPERIEQEWWLSDGCYRDYYCVEDQRGARYWLFRSGPYEQGQPQWFIHGFFA